jgi:hypothetical protein
MLSCSLYHTSSGASYQIVALVDEGPSGYSSLQLAKGSNGRIMDHSLGGGAGGSAGVGVGGDGNGGGGGGGRSRGGGGGGGGGGVVGSNAFSLTGESVWILYEQSDPSPYTLSSLSAEALIGGLAVLNPDRFVLRKVDL